MGPYAGVVYNLTLCRLQVSNNVPMGNPMSESTLTLCQSRLYPSASDLGLGLCAAESSKKRQSKAEAANP
jgi:hypothetical protein